MSFNFGGSSTPAPAPSTFSFGGTKSDGEFVVTKLASYVKQSSFKFLALFINNLVVVFVSNF